MKKNLFLLIIASAIILSVKAQNITNVKSSENIFVYGQSIKLFMGDKIYVEANIAGNSVQGFKVIRSITDYAKTITIELKYEDFGGQKSSILTISNPFENQIEYKAKIKSVSGNKYAVTSTVPVLPKIYSMEMWPNKLESIILSDFKITQ